MSKKRTPTFCLVIDASIARAAGSMESQHPTGVLCRDFLLSVRSVCHRMAWTESIKAEWDKHRSIFAMQWRTAMESMGKVRDLQVNESADLRNEIATRCESGEIAAIVLKDCHLIEAALAGDSRVASLDDTVRGHLSGLAASVVSLRNVSWVNPVNEDEKAVEWLEKGAPAQKRRRLRP